jgi:hypothetical protein
MAIDSNTDGILLERKSDGGFALLLRARSNLRR